MTAVENPRDLFPAPGLTLQQEMFARAYIECGGNASEAYRASYRVSNHKSTTIHRRAHEVLHNRKVQARIQQLVAPIVQEHEITVDKLVSMYLEAYAIAKIQKRSSAMSMAVRGIASVTGFHNADDATRDLADIIVEYVTPEQIEEEQGDD